MEHLACLFVVGDFIRKHTIINEPGTTNGLCEKLPLFSVGHSLELVRFVRKITNFHQALQTYYTTKEGNMQGMDAIHPTTLEVGDFLLIYVNLVLACAICGLVLAIWNWRNGR